jgi:hypothetical protein
VRACSGLQKGKRVTHLRTVRGQTPAVLAATPGLPCRTIRSRQSRVNRAFLSRFIRSSRESWKPRNSNFLGQDRVDDLMKLQLASIAVGEMGNQLARGCLAFGLAMTQ